MVRRVCSEVDEVKTVRVIVVRIVPALTGDLMSGAVGQQVLVSNFIPLDLEFSQTDEPEVATQNQDKLVGVAGLESQHDALFLWVFQLNVNLLRYLILSGIRKGIK